MAVAAPDGLALDIATGERVHAYARAVVAGEVVAGELVRLAAARHLRDLQTAGERGLRFDAAEAGWAIRFFPTLLRHYKGEWGPGPGKPVGDPIVLGPWQEFLVGSLFGWFRRNPTRGHPREWILRFTKAYVEVGKKNGKDLTAAGVGILRTFFRGEAAAETYVVATKRDQAKLTWNDMDTLVERSPALRARISRSARSLWDPTTKSKAMPLSSEDGTEEGINPDTAIVNELHRHRDRGMFDMIEQSFGARLEPLEFIITTAGEPGGQTVWASERRIAERVLRGLVDDDQLFALVFAIDEHDDPFDERCWPKANPGIGVSPKWEEMRQRAAEAKVEPAKRNAFCRLRLNRPMSASSRYFEMAHWLDAANARPAAEPDGADAWGGMDLGWSRDLSAAALWVPRAGRYELVVRAWAPEASARARGDGLYERFAEAGWLTLTEGDVRDEDAVEADILAFTTGYRIRRWCYDRAMASGLVQRLVRAWGEDVVEPVAQGWVSLSPAMKELERLAAAKRLAHGGNGLLLWAVGNTDGKYDDQGNVRPVKPNRNSPDKIDPVSAALDAIAGWLVDRDGDEGDASSAYETYRSLTL